MPGRNVNIEYRYAQGDAERIPALVAELVGLGVDVLLVSSQAISSAAEATRSIPIIMTFAIDDPVERGWAASLARPGGNITGITLYAPELTAKRLELLKTAVPALRRVGVLAPLGPGGLARSTWRKRLPARWVCSPMSSASGTRPGSSPHFRR